MYTIFEIKSRKGEARQFDFDEIGEIIWVDRQKNKEPGDKIIYDKVLVYGKELGRPYLSNIQVTVEVVKNGEDEKIIVFKKKAKKRYKKKQGHRQQYTWVKIIGVDRVTV